MFNPSERFALAAQDRPASLPQWLALVDSLHADEGFWWLDSAMVDGRLGRFSFVGCAPYLWLRSVGSVVEVDVRRAVRPGLEIGIRRLDDDPIEAARSLLPRADSLLYSTSTAAPRAEEPKRIATPDRQAHPQTWRQAAGLSDGLELPFLGGAVGYFGYELAASLEPRIRFGQPDDLELPDLALAFVDQVMAYDHRAERLWILGLGFGASAGIGGARSVGRRSARDEAIARSRALVDHWSTRVDSISASARIANDADGTRPAGSRCSDSDTHASTRSKTLPELESTIDASGYGKAVDTILEEIGRGNVYQANFSQRLSAPAPRDAWPLYQALRRANPAPFGAYLRLPSFGECSAHAPDADVVTILSSSPERFLSVDSGRRVESRPIKGTRPRGDSELEDARLEEELETSEKDQAENLMIVDLVRNDLGRVCTPGTIEVPELMEIEAYAAVFQMVSTVRGELATGRDAFDLIAATFPPGSMTGAPKLAAVELLERLESVRRGVYAGALGYLDLRGGLDLSVVIRTFVHKEGRAHLHVGGGVVADSSPEGEYLESLDKARAPLAALSAVLTQRSPSRKTEEVP